MTTTKKKTTKRTPQVPAIPGMTPLGINPAKLTMASARVELANLGFSLKKTGHEGELRVCPTDAGEAQAYYASDLEDAVETARNWK